jgi:hypothetical protein
VVHDDPQLDVRLGARGQHGVGAGHIERQWFFAQYVLTGIRRCQRRLGMQEVRKANGDRLDVVTLEQLTVVRVDLGHPEPAGELLGTGRVLVCYGDEVGTIGGQCAHAPGMGLGNPTAADDAVAEAIAVAHCCLRR